jgi:hypothetical protein
VRQGITHGPSQIPYQQPEIGDRIKLQNTLGEKCTYFYSQNDN